jgi:beta-glucosidase
MFRKKMIILTVMIGCIMGGTISAQMTDKEIKSKVDNLLSKMTMLEKIGQLVQYSGTDAVTGPEGTNIDVNKEIKEGNVGSLLNIVGAEKTREVQKLALESRLSIPLILGLDIIHGYKTIFPVPLGMASSWNMDAIKEAARIAAVEGSAVGLHWTFAPMVDIARDPRWGRIVEGAGEDPYLGSCIAKAQIEGFQGNDLSADNTILACAKHYIGYGAAMGGRDYNNAEIPYRMLWEIYLPPFEASIDAGVGTVMSAFNDVNGIPMTGNKKLINGVLKKDLEFKGLVVSDWNSVMEMIPHGYAKDEYQAAELAMNAGLDMDMVSAIYAAELPKLVKEGKITDEQINEAVKRVLTEKYKLGLFEDPYKYSNTEREKTQVLSKEHRVAAREVAKESIVLLKNENSLLPLKKNIKTIAVVGPLADSKDDMLGPWSAKGEGKDCITTLKGIKNAVSKDTKVLYSRGCDIDSSDVSGIEAAVKIAEKSDIVIAVIGEAALMSGEAHSRADINIPGVQETLLKELKKTGKPIIMVLMNGRPLLLNWEKENIPAILETWFLGTEAGNAVADVIFGDYNPSGKLTVSFPYAVGQIPIFYNHRSVGRPNVGDDNPFVSKYLDIPNEPLYPFGYGLSYATFKYSDIELSSNEIKKTQNIRATVNVTNTGKVKGKETVQVYIQDLFASVTQPVKRLIDFKQIELNPGETGTVSFEISPDKLKIYNEYMKKIVEPGEFKVYIGTDSQDVKEAKFEVAE